MVQMPIGLFSEIYACMGQVITDFKKIMFRQKIRQKTFEIVADLWYTIIVCYYVCIYLTVSEIIYFSIIAERVMKMSDNNNENIEEEQSQQSDNGIIASANARHNIHCLTVIGQVEGHYILPPQNKTTKYEHIIPALVAIEEDRTIEGLLIVLNTVGGDVEAGLAISELISGISKPTVSIVVGGGHSIGVPLAVSADVSYIVPSATMTIHPVRMNGMVLGVPQTMSYFEKMQERITRFVTANSRMTSRRFKELMMEKDELVMDVGTVLNGEAAVKEGLIDRLGGLSDAVECLYSLIEERNNGAEKRRTSQRSAASGSTARKKPRAARSGSKAASAERQAPSAQLNSADWNGER